MTMVIDRIQSDSSSDYRRASPRRSLRDLAGKITATLLVWRARVRERRELLSLDDLALHDFGASRADAASEGDKPFWQA